MYKNLVQVEPARPASGDTPAASPVYRVSYGTSDPILPGVTTLWENFE